jgi:hypothetical protein
MRAEKKCAASPGGTFFILLPTLTLSTLACTEILSVDDSTTPQPPILKENLLVARRESPENLARESLPIVAFRLGSTTSRITERFLVHP